MQASEHEIVSHQSSQYEVHADEEVPGAPKGRIDAGPEEPCMEVTRQRQALAQDWVPEDKDGSVGQASVQEPRLGFACMLHK